MKWQRAGPRGQLDELQETEVFEMLFAERDVAGYCEDGLEQAEGLSDEGG